MRSHITTHGVGLTGALLFLMLNLPLPWLFGPLSGCLFAALLGARLKTVKVLSDGMRTILGVAAGSAVSWGFITALPGLWSTLILIPMTVVIIGFVGVWYFQNLCGYDYPTAYYASMPGGLQDMLAFGEEAGGNVRAMSLIHATRVLVIIVLLPIILTLIWDANLDRPPGQAIAAFDPMQLFILGICAIVGWKIAAALGMFGATILGPLLFAAGASLVGVLESRPPAEAIWVSQYFIALGIGVKYVGITRQEIRHDIVAGFGFSLILLTLTIVVVGGVILLKLAPPMDALLSLAPGGQAELVVLALIVGADVGFVVAHHLFRIFIIILGAPVLARFMTTKPLD